MLGQSVTSGCPIFMTQVPFQVGPFEKVSIYDAPGQVMSMVWDGEFTARGAAQTFLHPSALSLKERDTVQRRLKTAAGNTSLTNALIDVATNPWVWLFAVTAPVGAEVTGSVFKIAGKYSAHVAKNAGIYGHLKMLSGQQTLRGSAMLGINGDFTRGANVIHHAPEAEAYTEVLTRVAVANGLDAHKLLSTHLYRKGSEQYETAKRLSYALQGSLGGLDRNITRQFVGVKEGKFITTSKTVPSMLAPGHSFDDVLGQFDGGLELRNATRDTLSFIREKNYGSAEKIIRGFRGLGDDVNDASIKSLAKFVGGSGFNKQAMKAIRARLKGGEKFDSILNEIETAYRPVLNDPNYFPSNIAERYKGGKLLDPNENDMLMSSMFPQALKSTNAKVRDVVGTLFHPDDIEEMAQLFTRGNAVDALSDAGRKTHAAGRSIIPDGSSVDEVEGAARRLFRTNNYGLSMQKHIDGNARMHALFIQDVGDDTLAAMRDTHANRVLGGKTHLEYAKGQNGVALKSDKPLHELLGHEDSPLGGFILADALQIEARSLSSSHAQRFTQDILMPHLLGRLSTSHAVPMWALENSKNMVNRLVGTAAAPTAVGEAISQSPYGKKMVRGMQEWADLSDDSSRMALKSEAVRSVRSVAAYLYVSHLATNMSSVVLNMSQPMLLAAPVFGAKHVAKGYGDFFQEFGDYMGKRQAQNFKALTKNDHDALIRNSFEFADEMGISSDLMETLEAVTFAARSQRNTPASLGKRLIFEYPMKLFEKVEWMNRGVTAHAVKNRHLAMGNDVTSLGNKVKNGTANQAERLDYSSFRREMSEAVDETQFGGHWLNTPELFLPRQGTRGIESGFFANGLIRQFLQFPLRQLTSVTHTLPRLAEREGFGSLAGLANDAGRAMAMSAIAYETGKNLLGADLERAGFFAATTELIPFVSEGRFDDREGVFPIPPILDIPLNIVKGMATDDKNLLAYSLARTIPSGVGLSRALGIVPNLPKAVDPLGLQRTYAAWNQRLDDGTVPLYKSDGTLQGFESPADLVMRGLGADLGRFKEQGSLERFLLANAEEERSVRREVIAAFLGNHHAKAKHLMRQFERRTGLPLTISSQQMTSAIKLREVGKTERILERMPSATREHFQEVVLQTRGGNLGLSEEQFRAAQTSSKRSGRSDAVRVDQEALKQMQEAMKAAATELPGANANEVQFSSPHGGFQSY